jgi:hypothetical protein
MPDASELEFETVDWPARARALAIVDDASYIVAGEMGTGIRALRERIAAFCDPNIRRWHDGHKAACEQKRALEAPLIEAEGVLKGTLRSYHVEQERVRQAEAARLAAEAAREDEDRRLEEATALERAGETEAAQQVLDGASFRPPPVIDAPAPAIRGVSTRKVWRAEVTDLPALLRAVADGTVPRDVVAIQQGALDRAAKAMRSTLAWPGVRAYCDTAVVLSGRGR